MAFPTTSVLDNFDRTEDPLSTNWATMSSADVAVKANGSTAQSSGGGSSVAGSYRTDIDCADQVAFTTLATGPGSGFFCSLALRVQSGGSAWYEVSYDGSEVSVYRVFSGGDSKVGGDWAVSLSPGHKLGATMIGTTIEAWVDTGSGWTSLGTVSDGTYSSGSIGIEGLGGNWRFDDFGGGEVVPPDETAPNTTITSGPDDPTTDTDAAFTFSADEEDCTFEVNLDGGGWTAASGTPANGSGATTCAHEIAGPLSVGEHTLQARATDAAENTDATPASHTWEITSDEPKEEPPFQVIGQKRTRTRFTPAILTP